MSIEFPRFRDITEYSTNAMIIPRKLYRHPALREIMSRGRTPFTAHQRYLMQKYEEKRRIQKNWATFCVTRALIGMNGNRLPYFSYQITHWVALITQWVIFVSGLVAKFTQWVISVSGLVAKFTQWVISVSGLLVIIISHFSFLISRLARAYIA